ncbi:MAG: hypothetical protein KatS3mg091_572 [Patescibacteria group bacterium]|nr:MAG: hypothetical protein KatS3mg091_572 [Patescibacteria group bacterium]
MFKAEVSDERPKAIIIDFGQSAFVKWLKKALKNRDVSVATGRTRPESLAGFDYIFIVDANYQQFERLYPYLNKAYLIFSSKTNDLTKIYKQTVKVKKKFKTVVVLSDFGLDKIVDRVLWFFFSSSSVDFLRIGIDSKGKIKQSFKLDWFRSFIYRFFNRKFLYRLSLFLFVFYNFLIWVSLGLGLYSLKNRFRYISYSYTNSLISFSGSLYNPMRPIYHFFLIGSYSDALLNLAKLSLASYDKVLELKSKTDRFLELFFGVDSSEAELDERYKIYESVLSDIKFIEDNLRLIRSNFWLNIKFMSGVKTQIDEISSSLESLLPVVENLDRILPDKKNKYIVFFANNMELRPGGGFLGSFAIVETKYLGVESLRFYDVYDADGQLKEYVQPPKAIEEYLNQPYWFLRDSNFSPDSLENFEFAKRFLELELGEKDFSGMIVVTVTAIQRLLSAYGDIYLPAYNDKVNAENFYVKTQYYVHKDFFPGSIRKKDFIGDLYNQLIINFEFADKSVLIKELISSLDEKYIVAYFQDEQTQKIFDNLFWSGRMFLPRCFVQIDGNCVPDLVFPVSANLGVNKANYYVKESLKIKVYFEADGRIRKTIDYLIYNTAVETVFLGGNYKNYFRLFLPRGINSEKLYIDGVSSTVDKYLYNSDVLANEYEVIRMYLTVPLNTKKTISLDYYIDKKLQRGRNFYQLVVQKQTGAPNMDLEFEVSSADNITLVNQNFYGVVKNNLVVYNTNLSGDKIFLLEVVKE